MNKYIVETVYQDSDHPLAKYVVEDEEGMFVIHYNTVGEIESFWEAGEFIFMVSIKEFYVDGDPL